MNKLGRVGMLALLVSLGASGAACSASVPVGESEAVGAQVNETSVSVVSSNTDGHWIWYATFSGKRRVTVAFRQHETKLRVTVEVQSRCLFSDGNIEPDEFRTGSLCRATELSTNVGEPVTGKELAFWFAVAARIADSSPSVLPVVELSTVAQLRGANAWAREYLDEDDLGTLSSALEWGEFENENGRGVHAEIFRGFAEEAAEFAVGSTQIGTAANEDPIGCAEGAARLKELMTGDKERYCTEKRPGLCDQAIADVSNGYRMFCGSVPTDPQRSRCAKGAEEAFHQMDVAFVNLRLNDPDWEDETQRLFGQHVARASAVCVGTK